MGSGFNAGRGFKIEYCLKTMDAKLNIRRVAGSKVFCKAQKSQIPIISNWSSGHILFCNTPKNNENRGNNKLSTFSGKKTGNLASDPVVICSMFFRFRVVPIKFWSEQCANFIQCHFIESMEAKLNDYRQKKSSLSRDRTTPKCECQSNLECFARKVQYIVYVIWKPLKVLHTGSRNFSFLRATCVSFCVLSEAFKTHIWQCSIILFIF